MNNWMQQPLNTEPAEPRRCPICSVPIYFSFRYGNIVREALQNMFESDHFKANARPRRRHPIGEVTLRPIYSRTPSYSWSVFR
jgi:hypothetical protein